MRLPHLRRVGPAQGLGQWPEPSFGPAPTPPNIWASSGINDPLRSGPGSGLSSPRQLLGSGAPPGKGRRLWRPNKLLGGGCDWSGRGWRWVGGIISRSPPPPPPQQLVLAAARVRRLCRHDGTCPAHARAPRRARAPARLRGGAAQRHVSCFFFVHFRASFGARRRRFA